MRKINTRDFRVATRSTSREINRRIALNVIREHQPISRAGLARGQKLLLSTPAPTTRARFIMRLSIED